MFLASYIEYYTTLYVFTHQLTYISINLPLILTRFYFRNNPNNKCCKMLWCIIPYSPIIAINIVLTSFKQVVKGYLHHLFYHIMNSCGRYVLAKHSLDRWEHSLSHPSTSVLSYLFHLRESVECNKSSLFLNPTFFGGNDEVPSYLYCGSDRALSEIYKVSIWIIGSISQNKFWTII